MSGLAFKTLGGQGPDLVLIHGFGSERLSWAGNAPGLMEVARVHALDLPGHGDSLDAAAGDGSPEALADAVLAALEEQGIERMHLLGHSLGGGIALVMAERAAGRVASLSLLAPAGLGTIDHDFLARFPELTSKEEAEALLHRLVTRPQLINRFTVARVLEQLERPGARQALRGIAAGVMAHEAGLAEAARRCAAAGVPRLALFGAEDAINPPHEDLLSGFGGRSLVIPGAGHLPHIEAARLVNGEITAFIRSHAG